MLIASPLRGVKGVKISRSEERDWLTFPLKTDKNIIECKKDVRSEQCSEEASTGEGGIRACGPVSIKAKEKSIAYSHSLGKNEMWKLTQDQSITGRVKLRLSTEIQKVLNAVDGALAVRLRNPCDNESTVAANNYLQDGRSDGFKRSLLFTCIESASSNFRINN